MANPNAKARVQRKYEAQYRDPIQVKAGESVEVGRADNDDPGWLWCRAMDCREGWVPVELLSGQEARAVLVQQTPGEAVLQGALVAWAIVPAHPPYTVRVTRNYYRCFA